MSSFLELGEIIPDPLRGLHDIFIPTSVAEQGKEAISRFYQDRVKEMYNQHRNSERT